MYKPIAQLKLFGNRAGALISDETKKKMSNRHELRTQRKVSILMNRIQENRELANALMDKMEMDIFPPVPGAGVYCVSVKNIYCEGAEHILYIGSSTDMHKRRSKYPHPYRIALQRFRSYQKAVYFKYYYTEDHRNEEDLLIQVFAPPLNKIMNPKNVSRKTLRKHYNAK